MRVLAIESATARGGVAVVGPSGVEAEVCAHVPGRHLEWMAGAIGRALVEAHLTPERIEGVAVSIGPGGFSSLRVGVATAAVWAHARRVPLVAVPTLEVLAAGAVAAAGFGGFVLAAIDARRGEICAALFRAGTTVERCSDEMLAPPEALAARIGDPGGPVLVAGEALAHHAAALLGALGSRARAAPEELWWPRAAVCGALGRARLLRGERTDPVGLVPRYTHRLVAGAPTAGLTPGRNGS
ncbi:MAG: tRNA (adenosine(37)-N6)-threonylcarbamoyltransferase complex dimerization subunit type 1 TsaB [Armatimonadota bacterium]|nr:tRNA (adenosine(37)-N6)-threonylcarbamoyltransferase complex dimerization subunit type 1 TsaB [Armatimonadota bacterium]MDR7422535.1 tRNA (adenosine(37)-N6)-threonylcarbamoyltransferase complex dimerization subunit type 1 TsaB [Armatimonadota bacterium]MDR7454204.1 tRNA (adenosine(37)-N6)-threonylcarbamoyltransferase complex dimerization subunit type 1 TsaB [Armatimonadota bacterium]MDR7458163.1 tRNA (adenosine(37)-N6)-threonylcarbamoyltransferase complex dimerization subunit type 1 TsaB [Arm